MLFEKGRENWVNKGVVFFKSRGDDLNRGGNRERGEVPAKKVDSTCIPSCVALSHVNLPEGSVKEWRQ